MNKAHKHAECIKAWADGAEIEFRHEGNTDWRPADCPQWNLYTQYRIKPQPIIVKKYTFYDRIERCVQNKQDLNTMSPQVWYNESSGFRFRDMLEWTFTDGVLTSVEMMKKERIRKVSSNVVWIG